MVLDTFAPSIQAITSTRSPPPEPEEPDDLELEELLLEDELLDELDELDELDDEEELEELLLELLPDDEDDDLEQDPVSYKTSFPFTSPKIPVPCIPEELEDELEEFDELLL